MKKELEKSIEAVMERHRDAFIALAAYDKQILPCEVDHLLEVIATKSKRITELELEVRILQAALRHEGGI